MNPSHAISITIFLVLVFCASLTFTQIIPRKCATDESIWRGRCCPIGNDGSPCNIASGRGKCTKINLPKIYHPNIIKRFPKMVLDPRFMWPSKSFKKVRDTIFSPQCYKFWLFPLYTVLGKILSASFSVTWGYLVPIRDILRQKKVLVGTEGDDSQNHL